MDITTLFIILTACCIAWYIVACILIMNYLLKKGTKINWLLVRLLILSYVNRYKQLTNEESGKTGRLFYHFVISVNGALVFAILTILFAKGIL